MAGCIGCGAEVDDGAKFCPHCGQPVIGGGGPGGVERSNEPPAPKPPPPEGLSLIVAKHRADWEVSNPPESRWEYRDDDGDGYVDPRLQGNPSPWKDHDNDGGFNLGYALVGAVVVAIVAAFIAWYFLSIGEQVSTFGS